MDPSDFSFSVAGPLREFGQGREVGHPKYVMAVFRVLEFRVATGNFASGWTPIRMCGRIKGRTLTA